MLTEEHGETLTREIGIKGSPEAMSSCLRSSSVSVSEKSCMSVSICPGQPHVVLRQYEGDPPDRHVHKKRQRPEAITSAQCR